jgi:hypothetical protein
VKVALFVGPTLRRAEIHSLMPEATCLPPAAQGDVYRVARLRPQAIGIVDGYFSGAPSVWHKEILWALSEGVPVFGSASMGALRASELHTFGMQGVGRIFEAFKDGELEDDDEVAVVHGPAELDFVVASQAMVNIRATLAQAEAEGVLRTEARTALEAIGKALFFPHRRWPALLEAARKENAATDKELLELERWLPDNAIDQKRQDALEMLSAMQTALAASEPTQPRFRFEWTHFWDNLVATIADEHTHAGSGDLSTKNLLDELRLQGLAAYKSASSQAMLRMLADSEARRTGSEVTKEAMQAASTRLRTSLSLFSRDQLMSWVARNDLDDRSFERLVREEAQLSLLAKTSPRLLDRFLLDELRLSGAYEALATRARLKAESISDANIGGRDPWPASGPDQLRLRLWFFEECLGEAIPEDMEAFARAIGLSGANEFDRVLLHEWLYCKREGVGRPAGSDGM